MAVMAVAGPDLSTFERMAAVLSLAVLERVAAILSKLVV